MAYFPIRQSTPWKWQSTVRPPRLGGNQRVGVFASRATHRPNPLGLSKVELRQVECIHGRVFLHLGSVDLVDGTPILILNLILPMLIASLRQNQVLHKKNHLRN